MLQPGSGRWGGGSDGYLSSGLLLGVPDWLYPPVPQFPHWLHGGRDLAWLPAWPPSLEFLLCACRAARKVLWESKYSSARRLQAGCSLSAEGHRERGCAGAGGQERGCSPSVLSPLSWGSPRATASPRAPWAGQTPGARGNLPIAEGSLLLWPRPRRVFPRSWAGVRGRGAVLRAFLTYLRALGASGMLLRWLHSPAARLRPGYTYFRSRVHPAPCWGRAVQSPLPSTSQTLPAPGGCSGFP